MSASIGSPCQICSQAVAPEETAQGFYSNQRPLHVHGRCIATVIKELTTVHPRFSCFYGSTGREEDRPEGESNVVTFTADQQANIQAVYSKYNIGQLSRF